MTNVKIVRNLNDGFKLMSVMEDNEYAIIEKSPYVEDIGKLVQRLSFKLKDGNLLVFIHHVNEDLYYDEDDIKNIWVRPVKNIEINVIN